MRKYFINTAKRLDFVLVSALFILTLMYAMPSNVQSALRNAIDTEAGINGFYDIMFSLSLLFVIYLSYIFTNSCSFGIFNMIRNELFYNGDVVLIKNKKNKKIYSASVVVSKGDIKKSNTINVSIYEGQVIEIPTENIVRLLDN